MELTVRRRRPGDRFQPLGMSNMKKLQDFMVDAKIRARGAIEFHWYVREIALYGWRAGVFPMV